MDFQKLYLELNQIRSDYQSTELQNLVGFNQASRLILELSLAAMFPFSFSSNQTNNSNARENITSSNKQKAPKDDILVVDSLKILYESLSLLIPAQIAENYILCLPKIKLLLLSDAESILEGDPAAKSFEEVVICYPGLFAIAAYRLANCLINFEMDLLARSISEIAHRETGIDIHPRAQIGERFCIDHGTGIVIGETTIIGRNVKLYHGVTLGGKSVKKNLAQKKRHPTIEDNVTIYSNAVILGGDTVIGQGSTIGGNVWLTQSIKPYSIVEIPEQQIIISNKKNSGNEGF